jgi:hypothetical protein
MSEEAKSGAPSPTADENFPIPPPSFEFLTLSFKTQAEMHMGLLAFGDEKPEPNAKLARHTIDLLAMLQDKTRGNLSLEEQRLLENSLTELRFRYLQQFGAGEAR